MSETFLLPFRDSAFPNLVNSSRLNRMQSGVGVCTCTSFQCHNTPQHASHEVITINVVYRFSASPYGVMLAAGQIRPMRLHEQYNTYNLKMIYKIMEGD